MSHLLFWSLVGAAAFALASLAVGSRLLWLARRTRQLPELLMGTAFLAGGALGSLLSAFARVEGLLNDGLRGPVYTASRLLSTLATLAILVAVWRIFRPRERWAGGAVALGTALLAGYGIGDVAVRGPTDPPGGWAWWAGVGVMIGAYAWTSVESFRYHALLRRRLALGLADAAVANRILLWGCGSGAIAVLAAVSTLTRFLAGQNGALPGLRLFTSAMGLACAVCIWLAFFPPAWYARRFRAAPPPAARAPALDGEPRAR